jgi:hypothetical protein
MYVGEGGSVLLRIVGVAYVPTKLLPPYIEDKEKVMNVSFV